MRKVDAEDVREIEDVKTLLTVCSVTNDVAEILELTEVISFDDIKIVKHTDSGDVGVINGFHPAKVHMIERNDDYFLGLRANHFVIVDGSSEGNWVSEYDKDGKEIKDMSTTGRTILVIANHKGVLLFRAICFTDAYYRKIARRES